MKVTTYYEHNTSIPIVKYGIKLVRGDIFERFEDGTIRVNGDIMFMLKQKEEKKEKKKEEKSIDFDFNKDGKVDEKDVSLAGKLLVKSRERGK